MSTHRYQPRRRRYLVYRTEVERFKNPFSRRSQQKSRAWKAYAILLGLLILGLIYFLFYSSVFRITSVEVNGAKTIKSEDITSIAEAQLKENRFLIFPEDNYFTFDKVLLAKRIRQQFVLEKLDISKSFPHGINIELEEKTSVATWVTNNKYYFLDAKGIAVKESPYNFFDAGGKSVVKKGEAEISLASNPRDISEGLPLVYDENNREVKLGETVVDESIIVLTLNLSGYLPKEGIEVQSFTVSEEKNRTLKVKTEEGWQIYFNYIADLNTQLNNLKTVLAEKIGSARKNLQYIDLRFGNRVYFK